ncbi:MAG: L-threonylcarbamoyladenylate synthase [Pseudomonadota bacterium]
MVTTERLQPDAAGIARAAELLRLGELVAFPTETVYGLGGDATNAEAVARIFEAKERPSFNPLIAHVAEVGQATDLIELPEAGKRLASAFWPGPLTLVAPLKPGVEIAGLATAGLSTIALRVPASRLANRLLREAGRPVAAPSANPSGGISPTRAEHVLNGLGGKFAAVLDGGVCEVGLESTILGFEEDTVVLLRPGGLTVERIEDVLGRCLKHFDGTDVTAPGQLASHYAPNARVRLNAQRTNHDELFLTFGSGDTGDLSLSPTGDLSEAAARLFESLHSLDAQSAGRTIAVAPIPEEGLGIAINDRLRRAAAPRD